MKTVRSLGGLRPNKNHKANPQAPEFMGRLLFTRDTLNKIFKDSQTNPNDLVEVGLAGWNNVKRYPSGNTDKYLTVEVRPVSEKQRWYQTPAEENPIANLNEFFQ